MTCVLGQQSMDGALIYILVPWLPVTKTFETFHQQISAHLSSRSRNRHLVRMSDHFFRETSEVLSCQTSVIISQHLSEEDRRKHNIILPYGKCSQHMRAVTEVHFGRIVNCWSEIRTVPCASCLCQAPCEATQLQLSSHAYCSTYPVFLLKLGGFHSEWSSLLSRNAVKWGLGLD